MTDTPKEKMPLMTRLHAIGAGLMIIGSPFAAFWSFGAAVMFLIVGVMWFMVIGYVLAEKDKKKKESEAKSGLKIVA